MCLLLLLLFADSPAPPPGTPHSRGANWMKNATFGAFPPGTTGGAFVQYFADRACTVPVNNGFDVKALTCGQYTDPQGSPLYVAAGCLHGASAQATCQADVCPGGCGSPVVADCTTAINSFSSGGNLPADAKCFGGSGNNDCINIEGILSFWASTLFHDVSHAGSGMSTVYVRHKPRLM